MSAVEWALTNRASEGAEAVIDGVTWGVDLWAQASPEHDFPAHWRIIRSGHSVCHPMDRLLTFPTRELAQAAAEFCAANPCTVPHCKAGVMPGGTCA